MNFAIRFKTLLNSPVEPSPMNWITKEILESLPEGKDPDFIMTTVAKAALDFSAKLWPADRTRRVITVYRDHMDCTIVRDWRFHFGRGSVVSPVMTTICHGDNDIVRIGVDEEKGEGTAEFLLIDWLEWFLENSDNLIADVRAKMADRASRVAWAVESYGKRKDKDRRKRK